MARALATVSFRQVTVLLACRVVGTATYGSRWLQVNLPALVTDRALHYPNGELARPSVRDLQRAMQIMRVRPLIRAIRAS